MTRAEGFPPCYDAHSRVLVLGSFPSVPSRREGFYYGNPQNRFWGTLAAFFGRETPRTVEEKRALALGGGIALWDAVVSCEIEGSADASIRGETVADLPALLARTEIASILCNGSKAYALLAERFPALLPAARRLPSTSPANPRFSREAWFCALREALSVPRGEIGQKG